MATGYQYIPREPDKEYPRVREEFSADALTAAAVAILSAGGPEKAREIAGSMLTSYHNAGNDQKAEFTAEVLDAILDFEAFAEVNG